MKEYDFIPKRLQSVKTKLIARTIIIFTLLLCLYVLTVFFTLAMIKGDTSVDMNGILILMTLIFMAVGFTVWAVYCVERDLKGINKSLCNLKNMTYSDKSKLHEDISFGIFKYGTFYISDKFMFVPKAGALIRLNEIEEFKSIFHYNPKVRFPDGIVVKMKTSDNVKYKFFVKDWQEYNKYISKFLDDIIDKGASALIPIRNAGVTDPYKKVKNGGSK